MKNRGLLLALFSACLFISLIMYFVNYVYRNNAVFTIPPIKFVLNKNENGKTSTKEAKVIRVIDGDTIEIEGGQKVRYIGINTPETVDPRKTVECFGKEAAQRNKELVEGKTVRLEKDISDKDQYGRLLRYVYVGGTFINLELVKKGFAKVSTFPPDVKYVSDFLKAENEARKDQIGLWSRCK